MDYMNKFEELIKEQKARVKMMKEQGDFVNYDELDTIVIGVVGGDGIGPAITDQAHRLLEYLLADEIKSKKVTFKIIDGLTIENRAKANKAIPDDVLEELKQCHVILKGPTTTPRKGDEWPNIESANVAMRKELDLFANVRPVKVPDKGIDWTFFRENTEGAYVLGSKGINIDEDIAIDFKVITTGGAERIARAAFEFAKKNGKNKVTVVTKANVVKTTDGKFLEICKEIGEEYEGIEVDDWYIDIMTAKLVDEKRRTQFQVMILPNLYGDILTDEAAEFQGGVGTAGSSNIGKKYAMFEAIHGSAPRMVDEGRDIYADPSSIIRAAGMLLNHIGYTSKADKLYKALEICNTEKKYVITGRDTGATNEEFTNYLMKTIEKL
ncbi:isocitrate/isopropylmalate family dehydrogenase [Vallitalea guaymasensis]|uniref:Isocitrate/isopropylmalate dehydrogenase family protein n=2 Tax=Vallitalea guaymasensis TaxID=1185412 RepID=A0A8J8M6U3_9FIRM|nr:isocitrate/isopropylmalate family dehydrogenase [Vallitalea guaymasensis]QUH27469.1 isocitrate/isopropylmalate dehydrogenase family protein [Vallitalea guaymasensis]